MLPSATWRRRCGFTRDVIAARGREAGGVSAAPRTPCVRHGAGARLGRRLGRARRRVRAGGSRAAEIRRFFPLFCGKNPSHFRSPSPVSSQYEFARACLTAEVFHGSAVRGETRHQVPLSLPRSPLFPEWSAELTSGISTASWLSHGHKRGQVFPCTPCLLTDASTVRYFPAILLSHGNKRGLYFPRNPAFSRAQVQSGISLHPCFLTGTSAVRYFPAPLPSHGNKRGQRRERM